MGRESWALGNQASRREECLNYDLLDEEFDFSHFLS